MSATATTFSYRVRDTMGRTQEGSIEAVSSDDARQRLHRDGFHVLELKSAEELWSLFPSRISRQDLIYVTAQLAIMVDTGIILSAALSGIIEQEKNSALRKVLQGLKEAVESGEDFSAALARYPKLFDNTYISLVKASEATGTLGTMLERIAAYLRKESDTFNKVRAAMAYPMIMMLLATGVTLFLLTYVMPKFMPLFKIRQTQLPARPAHSRRQTHFGLAQDQLARGRHDVSQSDDQPQHSHPGDFTCQRRARHRGHQARGSGSRQLLL
ncbi:MAG: type II secretion system F family protein [Thermoguttaceae bacterium]